MKIWLNDLIEPDSDNSPEYLFNYCIQGIVNNRDINDGKFLDWDDARHAASVYLADIEVPEEVIDAINIWLDGAKIGESYV